VGGELIRQINKGDPQVKRRLMQESEKNQQVESTFWQVRDFPLKKGNKKWHFV
jgi:hypothetical protein